MKINLTEKRETLPWHRCVFNSVIYAIFGLRTRWFKGGWKTNSCWVKPVQIEVDIIVGKGGSGGSGE